MKLKPCKVARIEAEDFKPTRKTLADRLALPNTYNDIPEYVCKHVILAFVDLNESVSETFTGICTLTMMQMVLAGLGYSAMAQTRLSLS